MYGYQTPLNTNPQIRARLWNRLPQGDNFHTIEGVLLQSEAYMPSPTNPAVLRRRFFKVTNEALLMHKGPDRTPRFLSLRWLAVSFFETDNPGIRQHFQVVMMLIKNGKFSRVFLRNEEEKELWRRVLTPICTMTDFFQRYKVMEIIKEKLYSKVSQG